MICIRFRSKHGLIKFDPPPPHPLTNPGAALDFVEDILIAISTVWKKNCATMLLLFLVYRKTQNQHKTEVKSKERTQRLVYNNDL